jgi:putative Mn2+ efflux pump MntP
MDILTIILIAVGLAMDCFAVSIAQGLDSDLNDKTIQSKIFLMTLLFGLFQGGMPLIGYYAGSVCGQFFQTYAPWVALVLLAVIGGKMVVESLIKNEEEHRTNWTLPYLLLMALATSIDALATGVVFILYPEKLWIGISIIALVSFGLSLAGSYCGKEIKTVIPLRAELIGGLILIAIGLKIWIEGICL